MAVTVRDTKTGGAATGNVTVTKPTGTVSGDLLVAFAWMDPDGSSASMTATGFTMQGSAHTIAGVGFHKVWTKVCGGAEPASYTFGGSGSATSVVVLVCLTGQDATTPVNATPTAGGSSTASVNHVAPTITTTVANTLLLCGYMALAQNATATYTPPAGMAELADVNAGSWLQATVASETVAAAGATGTRTATLTESKTYLSRTIAIAPAPSGTNAAAEVAALALAAHNATAVIAAAAEIALTAAAAQGATVGTTASTDAAATTATWTLAAPFDAGSSVSTELTAEQPVDVAVAGLDATTSTASSATAAATTADLTSTALDASVTTTGATSAPAAVAAAAVTAETPSAHTTTSSATAALAATGIDATATVSGATVASASGALVDVITYDATVAVAGATNAPAFDAAVGLTGIDTVATTGTVGAAVHATTGWTAYDPAITTSATAIAPVATIGLVAVDATARVPVIAGSMAWAPRRAADMTGTGRTAATMRRS